jgi:hypothetical protein
MNNITYYYIAYDTLLCVSGTSPSEKEQWAEMKEIDQNA